MDKKTLKKILEAVEVTETAPIGSVERKEAWKFINSQPLPPETAGRIDNLLEWIYFQGVSHPRQINFLELPMFWTATEKEEAEYHQYWVMKQYGCFDDLDE